MQFYVDIDFTYSIPNQGSKKLSVSGDNFILSETVILQTMGYKLFC